MTKPSFKHKPNKPARTPAEPLPNLDFIGMDQLLGVYADTFLVTATGGMFSLYFFQTQLPANFTGTLMQTGQIQTKQTKAVARIVITPEAMGNMVRAMSGHVGLKVEGNEPEAK